jgi:hypothetical protein
MAEKVVILRRGLIIMYLWSKNVYRIDLLFETLGGPGAPVSQQIIH